MVYEKNIEMMMEVVAEEETLALEETCTAALHITVEIRDFSLLSGPIYTKYLGGYSNFHAFYRLFHVLYI